MDDGEVPGYEADTLRRARRAHGILTRHTPRTPTQTIWMLPNPKGERTGKTRTEPTSITPIDLESGRGYDGPGQVVGPDSREPLDDHRVGVRVRVIIGIAQPA
jgi:hypothetical protein